MKKSYLVLIVGVLLFLSIRLVEYFSLLNLSELVYDSVVRFAGILMIVGLPLTVYNVMRQKAGKRNLM
ncbi:MAG: hypothetical protein ACEPOZ_10295 [Marinifilaceae bacterium]